MNSTTTTTHTHTHTPVLLLRPNLFLWEFLRGPPFPRSFFSSSLMTLLQTLASQASIQAFADGIVIWWTIGKGESRSVLGNTFLDIVLAWAPRWKVIFNPAKCKVFVISRLHHEPLPNLRFDGVALECVPSLRYLGVWLNSTLC